MTLTTNDLRRAILNGGDVSSFADLYRHVLADPPFEIVSGFDTPIEIPQPSMLRSEIDKRFVSITSDNRQSSIEDIDLKLVAMSRCGNNAAKYIQRIINDTRPDVIAVDACPVEVGAHIIYVGSLPYAVGLPVQVQYLKRSSGKRYANSFYYPSSTIGIALTAGWLGKIPVLPIGHPLKPIQMDFDPWGGHFDPDSDDRDTQESKQYAAHIAFESTVKATTNPREANNLAETAACRYRSTLNSRQEKALMEESGYAASRILDIAAYAGILGRKPRLLALVDIIHYVDTADTIAQMRQGTIHPTYRPPEAETSDEKIVLVGEVFDSAEGIGGENSRETTGVQESFQDQLDKFIHAKESEILPESKAYGVLPQITDRVRRHPDIARGPSVRGTIAFKEILCGYSKLNGILTRKCLMKAALITLPPRISVARKGNGSAIIGDIVKEILYHISFQKNTSGSESQNREELSAADILSALNHLGALPQEENQNASQRKSQAVVPDEQRNQQNLQYLEDLDLARRNERGQYVLTGDAFEFLLNGLEQQLSSGEISLQEYHRQKSVLMQQMKNAAGTQVSMSKGELANTIFEMIDAQDKQWNPVVDFSTLYVYYHIKSHRESEKFNPQKSDYHGLKRIMDDLVRQRVLVAAEEPSACNLTGFGLDVLFQYFIGRSQKGEKVNEITTDRERLHNERSNETRKFSSGDTYRNISMRRTLKEIARQRKSLSDVRKNDFRVFIPQSSKPKADILLCLDTSGSMGFNQKLMYARLAAAGIARAAIKDGNRVGVVAFNDFGKVTMPLMEGNEESILDLIAKISPRGNTNIGDGIKFSTNVLLDGYSRNQKHIILISDGIASAVSESAIDQLEANTEADLTEESALLETKKAAAKGIKVSVVYIAPDNEVSDGFISNIARFGNGRVYRVADSKALTILFG